MHLHRLLFTLVSLLASALPSAGAVTLKGVVLENEVGGPPMPGVALFANGANPTVTGDDGAFTLEFPSKSPGDASLISVRKDGFQVVNDVFLHWPLPSSLNDAPLVLLIAKNDLRAEMALRFYRLQVSEAFVAYYKRLLSDTDTTEEERAVVLAAKAQALSYVEQAAVLLANSPNHLPPALRQEMLLLLQGGKAAEVFTLFLPQPAFRINQTSLPIIAGLVFSAQNEIAKRRDVIDVKINGRDFAAVALPLAHGKPYRWRWFPLTNSLQAGDLLGTNTVSFRFPYGRWSVPSLVVFNTNSSITVVPPGATNCPLGSYTSIQDAVDAAPPAVPVMVGPGRYLENVVMPEYSHIRGQIDGRLSNGANASTLVGVLSSPTVTLANGCTLETLTITRSPATNADNTVGVRVDGCTNSAIIKCRITQAGRFGISVRDSETQIVANLISSNAQAGIRVDGTTNLAYNNVIVDHAVAGILLSSKSGTLQFYNNTLARNAFGVLSEPPSEVFCVNNLIDSAQNAAIDSFFKFTENHHNLVSSNGGCFVGDTFYLRAPLPGTNLGPRFATDAQGVIRPTTSWARGVYDLHANTNVSHAQPKSNSSVNSRK